jgi:hypothetical protein
MKGLEKFMVEVFPWKTITVFLGIIATCEMVQVAVLFWRHC